MPFGFRKSIRMGPARVNLSKSGVGASVGVKGARIGTGPRGAYVRMGAYGITYQQRLGPGAMGRPSREGGPGLLGPTEVIASAGVDELLDATADDVLEDINNPPGRWWQRLLHTTKPVPLFYDFESAATELFGYLEAALAPLSQVERLWFLQTRTDVDRRYYAGANTAVTRTPTILGRAAPPGIETNVNPYCVHIGTQILMFLPDRLFVRQGRRYAAVPYSSIHVAFDTAEFSEEGAVPGDAQIIRQTWRFVNKNGGPDRRFNNNRSIPVAKYAELRLWSDSGVNAYFYVSNFAAGAASFTGLSSVLPRLASGAHAQRPPSLGGV